MNTDLLGTLGGGLTEDPGVDLGSTNLQGFAGMNEQMLNQSVEAATKPMKIVDKGDSYDFSNVSKQTASQIMEAVKGYQQVRASYNDQINKLALQEQAVRSNPLASVLGTVASSMAMHDPKLPGWIRGLGAASAQLNPTADQLAQRRMDLMSQLGALGGREVQAAGEMARIAGDTRQAEFTRKSSADLDKRVAGFLKDMRLTAGKAGGPVDEQAFYSGARAAGIPAERWQDAYRSHVAEAQAAIKGQEKKSELKVQEAEAKAGFTAKLTEIRSNYALRNRIAGIDEAFKNSVSPTKEAFELKMHEQKKAIDEAAAGRKELGVLGAKDQGLLKQASATNTYIGTVEHMLEQPEFSQVQGPLFQWDPAKKEVTFNPQAVLPKQFKNIDRTVVESQIAHEIPRLLTLLINGQAGGASILRIEAGQKLIKDMGITGSVRPDQALAILKIVRDTNNSNVAATMRAHPNAQFGAMKDLLGVDDPKNHEFFYNRKTAFGAPVQLFPDFERRGTGKNEKPGFKGTTKGGVAYEILPES